MARNDIPKNVRCSFCGKSQENVRKIVAGPGVYICDECVDLCTSIIQAEEYEDEEVYEDEDEELEEDKKIFGRRNNKVVNMPQSQSQAIKMVISQPTTFEQSDEICSFLKEKKSVIVNLEYVNKDVARRIVDFISGGVYALDGYIQKVSNSIFLVAPSNYEITNEMAREEIKNKLSVSWLKNNGVN